MTQSDPLTPQSPPSPPKEVIDAAKRKRDEELRAERPWRHAKEKKHDNGQRWHPNDAGIKQRVESGEAEDVEITRAPRA